MVVVVSREMVSDATSVVAIDAEKLALGARH